MTLYYPSGLYGPICDIQPPPIVEPPIVPEVVIQTPKIDPPPGGEDPTDDPTNTDLPSKLIPKICRNVSTTSLYRGNFGAICDIPLDGNSDSPRSIQICIDEPPDTPPTIDGPKWPPPPGVPTYRTTPNPPPEDPIIGPNVDCIAELVEVPTPFGIKEVIYYSHCGPDYPEYKGPDLEDYGIDSEKNKIKYRYYHKLICGAVDYYNSPGTYTNSIPRGITVVNIFAYGAGGGAGGTDQAQGPAGSGNNSGGSGSFAYLTVTLDPTINNILTIVVGGGGNAGRNHYNSPEMTNGTYNRGGKGGYPGYTGLSGGGGGGGGATDVFLNDRLIVSSGGGGGGGANGCLFWQASVGAPYANWNNYSYNNSLTTSSEALDISVFSPLMAIPMYEPTVKHSLWGPWFKEYAIWFDENQSCLPGTQLENRVNLNFAAAGSYTFEYQGDNQLAIYIAPWEEFGDGIYVEDNLYNGFVSNFKKRYENNIIPSDSNGTFICPSTLPADITGADPWQFLGYTTNFITELPDSVTFNITSPGRYVIRTILQNLANEPNNSDWLYNPAGMAIVIKNPNNSILWTTKFAFGDSGENFTGTASTDGGGAGGGGGNTGRGGLTAPSLGLGGGSCQGADSTAQAGSAGWSYILDHPAISVEFFAQAPSGQISGWETPRPADASVRISGGGIGGGRPRRMNFIFDNIEYPLYNVNGSFATIVVPGMGTGVWEDFMSGKTFQYNYFWGVSKDGSPDTTVPTLIDSGANFGKVLLGSYQGAFNSSGCSRSLIYRPRSLQIGLLFTPIKINSTTWNTQIRISGFAPWGLGTGFAVGDILPSQMPPNKSLGTQPWWDVLFSQGNSWHTVEAYDSSDKRYKLAHKPGQVIDFQLKVTEVRDGVDAYVPGVGQPGFVRTQYYSTDYEFEEEVEV